MAIRFYLTTNADTVLPTDDDLTVYGTQPTLNLNDSLAGGGGFDTLALGGSGTFDLTSLPRFDGFEAVTLTNETTTAATLKLRDGTSSVVTLDRGQSTATTDANGSALINVYLGTGTNTIIGGAENDAFYVQSPSDIHPGDTISGGGGVNTLYIGSNGPYNFSDVFDISQVQFSNISSLIINSLNPTNFRISSSTLVDIPTIYKGDLAQTSFITSDSTLYLNNIVIPYSPSYYVGHGIYTTPFPLVGFTSDNAAGTTFYLNGTSQASVVAGGPGSDTVVSQTVISFNDREKVLSRSIETVTDPSGSYHRLVSITTPNETVNTSHQVISGTVDASATGTVSVYSGSNLVGTAAIQADHTWVTTVSLGPDASYSLQAQVGDAAGDVGRSNSVVVTVDTSPPVVSINNSGGDVTDRYVNLSGSAVTQTANGINASGEAGATVKVYEGSTLLGGATVDSGGHWSLGVVLAGAGGHTLVASETDGAGNVGRSNSVTFNALDANPGNDTLFAGAGTSILDGGAGDDTVVLPYTLTQASLSYDAAGRTILDGPNGAHDVLSGFEHYRFTDGTVNEHASSALVDDLFYYAHNNDVWNVRVDATAHYNASGWHEGRDPNADFSTTGYLAANADVRAAGINPLSHYDANGWKEGRDPSANFDNELYLSHNPDVKAAGVDPLAHYLTNGQAEGRQAYSAVGTAVNLAVHPGFDAEYYLLSNADVAKAAIVAGGDSFAFAYNHYETSGWHEGRNPNAVFDVKGYLAAYGDVKAANIDPLAHYEANGWKEGRDPSASFDVKAYESHYTDVANAHIDPMLHYLQSGALEGRTAFNDGHFG
ncbi:hypothetical protein AFCDBAGC_1867 [Methylobacterium cerastii]|uniref:Bacterial Ig domain-containing protein n=1 Tax=Methylobacterium cerastii TaxID=932741 RepID=A0ABQ4QGN3_9HYPH|nr:Ig-like domain-containing protein [Methylobacterium cerastii]GJD44005.1 hypothetical protein AFCDBAGC_1867 [Methylobacterium cerastii]